MLSRPRAEMSVGSVKVSQQHLWLLQVDLIVCFDSDASPIRNIQRMGRTGRHKPGRVVYIMSQGKEEESYRKGLQVDLQALRSDTHHKSACSSIRNSLEKGHCVHELYDSSCQKFVPAQLLFCMQLNSCQGAGDAEHHCHGMPKSCSWTHFLCCNLCPGTCSLVLC